MVLARPFRRLGARDAGVGWGMSSTVRSRAGAGNVGHAMQVLSAVEAGGQGCLFIRPQAKPDDLPLAPLA